MKRSASLLLVGVLAFAPVTAAFAHVRVVTTPSGQVHGGWVGSGALPGNGKGLIAGGPDGDLMLSPSHAKGLVTACHALEGNSTVDIRGPGGPGCPHGE